MENLFSHPGTYCFILLGVFWRADAFNLDNIQFIDLLFYRSYF